MIESLWLKGITYEQGLVTQLDIVKQVSQLKKAKIIGCEHEPVFTLGIRGEAAEDILDASMRIPILKIHRGGQAVYHGPGQLVMYPIVPLKEYNLGVKKYVEILTDSMKEYLTQLNIECWCSSNEPGIFTKHGKIGMIGVQIKRGVSFHGLALNISANKDHFNGIRTCGISNQSIANTNEFEKQTTPHQSFLRISSILSQKLNVARG